MAKLDITLSKEQHETLDDSLKSFYVPTQDGKGFELEGIGSIQRALDAEKLKKTTKPELLSELEQLREFKSKHEQAEADAAQDLLVKKGEFEEAQKARDLEWQKRLDTAVAEKDSLFSNVHRERLTNELVKRGVLPDRAEFLVDKLVADTELVKSDAGFDLRKKGGIGDATEFDGVINAVKEKHDFFFASQTQPGGGALGSGNNGGNAKTMPEAQFDALSPKEQSQFVTSGGQVT